ncbi:MAG: DNA polymerase III subunit gamma/tau [Phycisphaerae bacterium]
MAYTVLARKYRSRTFEEVIGQEPIATTLVNAIKAGRIHHGYLFTGTRGVGKTSMARILAKALNCLKSEEPTVAPCCECDACSAIAEGRDIDVVEIDAASNTGVDNIRELRSNTAYRPARARFKIYIIDEVHMLSTGAFNALLKTLEEPPEHVKFVLATTEVQKVPATIQSRCQRFTFRNIGPEAIADRLKEIAKAEGAKADDAVVRRVARLANGSMRDGLSILDQLLSVSPKKLTADVLDEILPPPQDEQILALLGHAAEGDAGAVLQDVEAVLGQGRGLEVFCAEATAVVRMLMLVRACGPDAPMIDVLAGARDEYVALSRRFELSQYVQMIGMLEELRRNVRFSGAGRALTDAVAVRLAHMHAWAPIEELLGQVAADGGGADEKKKYTVDSIGQRTVPAAAVAAPVPIAPAPVRAPAPPPPARVAPAARVQAEPEVARRVPVPAAEDVPPTYGPDVDDEPCAVPDDYTPGEVESPPAVRTMPKGAVSSSERARILKDPMVQRLMDLFDGELVYVERRPQAPAGETTE